MADEKKDVSTEASAKVEEPVKEEPKTPEVKPEEVKPVEEKPAEVPVVAAPEPKIVKKEAPPTPEEIAKELDEQIGEVKKSDYWILRIRKQTILVFLGVVLLTLWLMPFIQQLPPLVQSTVQNYKLIPKLPFIIQKSQEQTAPATPIPTPIPTPEATTSAKIRVRYIPSNTDQAKLLADTLAQAGFGTADLAEDKQITEKTNSIVVKPDGLELRAKLQALLKSTYSLATSSAQLAADSDFDALILLGKNN